MGNVLGGGYFFWRGIMSWLMIASIGGGFVFRDFFSIYDDHLDFDRFYWSCVDKDL